MAARLERHMKKRGHSLKAAVNDALRAGLEVLDKPPARRSRFRTKGFALGDSLVGSVDNIEEVLSRMEGDEHP